MDVVLIFMVDSISNRRARSVEYLVAIELPPARRRPADTERARIFMEAPAGVAGDSPG
jgi:hypothetical protein